MSESEKPFTVKDRRHFTPEGEVREVPEASEAETAAESPSLSRDESRPVDPPPASEPRQSRPPGTPPSSDAPEDAGAGAGAGGEPPRAPGGPVDLGQFLLSLGAQASMLLTGQGLPEGADQAEALAGARSIISIIEMLELKTQGNRSPEESQVLEGLLYELRMGYLERSRGGGS